jgi:hypothetical protein
MVHELAIFLRAKKVYFIVLKINETFPTSQILTEADLIFSVAVQIPASSTRFPTSALISLASIEK